MTSYEVLCENFDWEECIEDDNDHQQTKITPGKEVQTLTFIDILNEILDNDIRAAKNQNMHAYIRIGLFDQSQYGNNVLSVISNGPGHGKENMFRFLHRGNVNRSLSAEQQYSSNYGWGFKEAQAAAAPHTLAISISPAAEKNNTYDVHVHFWKDWNWSRLKTVSYTLTNQYLGTSLNSWVVIRESSAEDEQRLLEWSGKCGFVNDQDSLKRLVDWVGQDSGKLGTERELCFTGVARFMINIRPRHRKVFTEEDAYRELRHALESSYIQQDYYSIILMGAPIVPVDLNSVLTITSKMEVDGCIVMFGMRKKKTLDDGKGFIEDNSDGFYRPRFALNHRFLKPDDVAIDKHLKKIFYNRKKMGMKFANTLSCLFSKKVISLEVRDRHDNPNAQYRAGTDFCSLTFVPPEDCNPIPKDRYLKTAELLAKIDERCSGQLVCDSQNMVKLAPIFQKWQDDKDEKKNGSSSFSTLSSKKRKKRKSGVNVQQKKTTNWHDGFGFRSSRHP